jgi:hypothetical protein
MIAARKKPAPIPVEAAASFAAPERPPQMPAMGGPYVPVEAMASAAPAETTGTATPAPADVQLVDASEFNDIDRQAESGTPPSADTASGDETQTHSERANSTWLGWIWSALGTTFAALATAVHQLIRV